MDWSPDGDYMNGSSDDPYNGGIYLLDSEDNIARLEARNMAKMPPPSLRAFHNPVGGAPPRFAMTNAPPRFAMTNAPPRSTGKETFASPIQSNENNIHAIYDVAYNDWPMRFNPNAGPADSNLLPSQVQRPYGGGWSPSQFPAPHFPYTDNYVPRSCNSAAPREYFDSIAKKDWDVEKWQRRPFNFGCDKFTSGNEESHAGILMSAEYVKIFLMVIVIILLAISLTVSLRLSRSIDKTIKTTIKVMGSLAAGQRPVS
jgi:hypothetical protein